MGQPPPRPARLGRLRPAALGVRERRAARSPARATSTTRTRRTRRRRGTQNWLNYDLGRFVVDAASYRFLHSYLYEPRPSVGRYYLSSQHLARRVLDRAVGDRPDEALRPGGGARGPAHARPVLHASRATRSSENLDLLDPDQAMLQQAKQDGDDVAGVPFTAMHTQTAMDYLDANKAGSSAAATATRRSPTSRSVVEKHYAWDLPLIVGGVATNNNGVPWGFLASVNDLFKTSQADEDQQGRSRDPPGPARRRAHVHVDPRAQPLPRPRPSARHDRQASVVTTADGRRRPSTGTASTGRSTRPRRRRRTRSISSRYSILDQETIARGHLAYYLKWTNEALKAGGDAFAAEGLTTIDQLPATAKRRRQKAIDAHGGGADSSSPASTSSTRPSPRRRRGSRRPATSTSRSASRRGRPRSRTARGHPARRPARAPRRPTRNAGGPSGARRPARLPPSLPGVGGDGVDQ